MISLEGKGTRLCDGITRREFVKVGALGTLGLTLADWFRFQDAGAVETSKGQINCIMLWLLGAPSHLDTWDMKPDAPANIRGPYKPAKTNVPGIELNEHFTALRRMADKFSLVRSVTHPGTVHEQGHQYLGTGVVKPAGQVFPHFGSIVASLRGSASILPPFIVVPAPMGDTGAPSIPHGQEAGWLGKQFDPYFLGNNFEEGNTNKLTFQGPDFTPAPGLNGARLTKRMGLRQSMDELYSKVSRAAEGKALDASYERAYNLLFSPEARTAFDISRERPELRDRYGRHTFGQSCLLARRLVERGVPFVTVNMFDTVFNRLSWDTHAFDPFPGIDAIGKELAPMFDQAYSALLEDLAQRGLLDSTLVVVFSEFGRTPNINDAGGRDHWPYCYTIFFSGGRIKGGQVVGKSDNQGGQPAERPVKPKDVAATLFAGMGIDPDTNVMSPGGRPVKIVDGGEVISELL